MPHDRTLSDATYKQINKPLTREEYESGIFIDFEKTEKDPPAILGVYYPTANFFCQYVLTSDLRSAADAKQDRCQFSPLREVVHYLLELANDPLVRIVAWSSHELDVIRRYSNLPEEDWNRLVSQYRDGRATGKKWKRTWKRSHQFKGNALKDYFSAAGYKVPRIYGSRQAAQRIRHVQNQLLRRGGDYAALTTTAKGKWTKLLNYNKDDCYGLKGIMQYAVNRFEPMHRKGN